MVRFAYNPTSLSGFTKPKIRSSFETYFASPKVGEVYINLNGDLQAAEKRVKVEYSGLVGTTFRLQKQCTDINHSDGLMGSKRDTLLIEDVQAQ